MRRSLILLPGHMCDQRLFSKQVDYFKNDFDIYIVDISKHETIEETALDVLKVAPNNSVILGLSMGGIIAMEVVRLCQERFSHLILIDTNPNEEKIEARVLREKLIEKVANDKLIEVMEEYYLPKYFCKTPKEISLREICLEMALSLGGDVFIRQSRALINRPSQIGTLKSLKCKTLILYGKEDQICPLLVHREMNKLIISSELTILNNTGHLPTLENPVKTNYYVDKFINLLS